MRIKDMIDINIPVNKAFIRLMPLIEQEAKNSHKYQSRTGRLSRATSVRTERDMLQGYINDHLAPYGKYIHDGFKSWSPDPFIEQAIINNITTIDSIIDEEITKYLEKELKE
jgi:hypothetical protein